MCIRDRLYACSTICQTSYSLLGIASCTAYGVTGGIFYFLSHSLGKAILFSVAGIVIYETRVRSMRRLGGLARRMPLTATLCVLGSKTRVLRSAAQILKECEGDPSVYDCSAVRLSCDLNVPRSIPESDPEVPSLIGAAIKGKTSSFDRRDINLKREAKFSFLKGKHKSLNPEE